MLPRLDKLTENCAEYLKSHKRWLNYFTFWKQGGKDHTAEQLATEMEGIIEELGNSDQNLVLNKLDGLSCYRRIQPTECKSQRKDRTGIRYIFPDRTSGLFACYIPA